MERGALFVYLMIFAFGIWFLKKARWKAAGNFQTIKKNCVSAMRKKRWINKGHSPFLFCPEIRENQSLSEFIRTNQRKSEFIKIKASLAYGTAIYLPVCGAYPPHMATLRPYAVICTTWTGKSKYGPPGASLKYIPKTTPGRNRQNVSFRARICPIWRLYGRMR